MRCVKGKPLLYPKPKKLQGNLGMLRIFKNLTFSFIFLATASLSLAADPATEPFQPEQIAGVYQPVEFLENGHRRLPPNIFIEEITILVDKASNTLKTIITKAKNGSDHEGDYFLVPFYRINLSPRTTEENYEKFCIETLQTSRSIPNGIETEILSKKKWDCSITIKKNQSYYKIEETIREGEILFTARNGKSQLSTFRFKRVNQ